MDITKGEWWNESGVIHCEYIDAKRTPNGPHICAVRGDDPDENHANAELIAEAGTVTNETGYTPRQLADALHETRQALSGIVSCDYDEQSVKDAHRLGSDILKKNEPPYLHAQIKGTTKVQTVWKMDLLKENRQLAEQKAELSDSAQNVLKWASEFGMSNEVFDKLEQAIKNANP